MTPLPDPRGLPLAPLLARRQRDEQDRSRDERRRRAREEGSQTGGTFGTYSGAKIRGLDELKKLFDEQQGGDDK